MIPPPPRSTLFPYTTLFRSRSATVSPFSTASDTPWSTGAAPYDACTSESRSIAKVGLHHRRRSEEHTSELQSQSNLVCRLLLEKKKIAAQHPVHGESGAGAL